MDPKLLTENGWKAIRQKAKVEDNGLQRALAAYEKLDRDKHEIRLKGIAAISQLASALKKEKAVAAAPAAAKYLTDLIGATELERREIVNARAVAEKALRARAEAEKKAEAQNRDEEEQEEGEDQAGDSVARLKKALLSLKNAKEPYYFLACDAKPYGLVISRRNIKSSAPHKKELAALTGGSTRPPTFGTCRREGNTLICDTEKAAPGLARILQKWIKTSTGLVLKVVVGDESAEDEEAPLENMTRPEAQPSAATEVEEPLLNMTAPFSISGSVGRGGKNHPDDVQAVQIALNRRAKAGLDVDGKCGPDTIKAIEAFQRALGQFRPDGRVDPGRGTARALAGTAKITPPPPPPQPIAPPKLGKASLAKAPEVWNQTRRILDKNIEELKKGVRAHYGAEHPDLVALVEQNIIKMNSILDRLDDRLEHCLAKAHAAADGAARKAELQVAKSILTEYIRYVKSEPLIGHIDSNPFGVDTNLKKVITDSLTHMAQSIG